MDLFYPLSPKQALRVEDERGDGIIRVEKIGATEVTAFNAMVYSLSHEQAFADREDRLVYLVSA